jgi:hypothetical protein
MNRPLVLKWIGSAVAGWFLLFPAPGDPKSAADPSESLVTWRKLGAFDSALACELARLAKSDRERSQAVCVFSDDPRLRR